jgi:site-specific DNA recombinase
MSSHWTGKANGKRYLAYVCQSIIRMGAKACPGSRVPAHALETFVIEKVRAVGRDPEVLSAAVAAAGGELKAQRGGLVARVKRLDAEAEQLKAEQSGLVKTVSQAGRAVPELVGRLDSLRGEVEAAEAALKQAKAELAALKRQSIDEGELRQAIQSFDGVWQHLFPTERQRILHLLIERIVVTASPDGEDIAITYSAEGARTLLTETSKETP